ncbi:MULTISPECIES: helix-turn-helix domain-containing protein [Cystobacter]|jgi:transcriptional regulator with XRE-family HTH domain|uniref:Transcriptional regulator n=1 Tax=Cystobacter ferrugineus TaxID=83449 RepID=A0A1L9BFJ0_9BACT|nr:MULTISPECIES: helix-turn-helix transcriptional regulator [Cystobacter]OJH41017.1 transcriptional regulator [Cystobacter ferrugineus]
MLSSVTTARRPRSKRSTPAPQVLTLAELRRLRGLTQVEAATAAGMDQSELSKAERRADHRLSTLQRYVEALGGKLEVFARFGSKRVRLKEI